VIVSEPATIARLESDPPIGPLRSRDAMITAMTAAKLAIGIGAFAVDVTGSRVLEVQPGPKVRAASTLKPLLAWAAAASDSFTQHRATWEALARRSITVSDNGATAELWLRAGEEGLLAWLNERVNVAWQTDAGGEHPSLRVLVTAAELVAAYAELASDPSLTGVQVRQWMREVPAEQTFGVRAVACDTLRVDAGAVGVKCGWFGGDRAHAIVLVGAEDRVTGASVTTSGSPDARSRAAVRFALGDDVGLVAAHDVIAGSQIRSAMRRALIAAAEL
jgi:hypothetical protein